MTNETPTVAHLFAEALRDRDGGFTSGDWRSLLTPQTVSLTYGFPFPESFPNEELVAAAETLFEAEGDRALQYGGGDYADRLPGIVAERARERGIDCGPEEILITNGATNALDLACRAFVDPGDTVFVEGPTFTWSLRVILNHAPETAAFEVDADGVDVDAVADELERRRREGDPLPKLFYTIPDFQNPTGTTLSRERRERLIDLAAEYDFVILEDDAYGELRYYGEDVPTLRSLDGTGRVVSLGTFSKILAPGVRTGWAIADEGIVERMGRMHTGGANAFTKGLITAYCEEGYLAEAVPDLRDAYRERRDHMLACLERHMPAAEWTEPDGGFFVWIELPEGVDAGAMLEDAIAEGVAYLPGRMFFAGGEGGENALRLSFSHVSLPEMERGIEALARATRKRL